MVGNISLGRYLIECRSFLPNWVFYGACDGTRQIHNRVVGGAWIPGSEWCRLDTATNPEMVHQEWKTA